MAPPLVISREDLDWGLERVEKVFASQYQKLKAGHEALV